MIYIDTITINGKQFTKTYSDTFYIVRDGVSYSTAIDPLYSGREYIESDIPLHDPELSAEDALEIIVNGGAENA